MMHGRDLERIYGGINRLRFLWVAADIVAKTIQISYERVREDVLLCPATKQECFDFGAPLRSRRTKRRYEDERFDRRGLFASTPALIRTSITD